MALLKTFKRKISGENKAMDAAFGIYHALVDEARAPALFRDYDIPDTIDGRFDAIVLHIALFLVATVEVLEAADREGLGRDVIGIFLKDMDRNLREIGVGDLGVGKQVKKMAAGLYGRLQAYQEALEGKAPEKTREMALAKALARNLYRDEKSAKATALSRHSLRVFARMKTLSIEQIMAGETGAGDNNAGEKKRRGL